jgi:MFS family permease
VAAPSPSLLRRGLVASTWEGAFAQAFLTLTSGVFLVKHALRLGASDAVLGLLAALPFLAQTLQLATAWWLERGIEGRRGFTAWTLLAARLLWIAPAAVAFADARGPASLAAYLAVVAASALLATAGAHGWISWMTDLVPVRVRGRYFGIRGAVAAVVAVAVAAGGGAVLDALEERRDGLGWATVYGIAAAMGLLAWVAIRAQHHPHPRREHAREPFARLWREIWAGPRNRRVFAFFVAWNAALGVAVPFWAKFMERDLAMSTATIGVQGTVGALVGASLYPAWGRLVDRTGLRVVLLANATCIAGIPFLWLFARPGSTWPVWVDAFAVGVFWSGFNLAALNVPLSVAPARGRATFVGVFGALTGLALGLSCVAGGALAQALGPSPREVLGLTLAPAQVMFLISGVLRVAALPLAVRMPDPLDRSLVFLVGEVGHAVRQRLAAGRAIVTAPWRKRP